MKLFPNLSIAIVDDSPVVRAFTSFLLTRLDVCIIFEAENGQVCIDKMRQAVKLPSVIILDIEMPVMDGFETAQILKRDWPSLKIIAFSSKNDADSMQRILAGGADFFLNKGSRHYPAFNTNSGTNW
ncbi:response regulator [Dyadobacter frigoris]|uniref:Response regulator n=1 Tax=Dyadobacter frigoris TaxID=2576211 RepID=A0A4U6DAJ6_9BACT|nr:response regulator transcription factor [Dyadobacter frigoris]TKT93327.1 response regulator [Dyadobacter frigoris]